MTDSRDSRRICDVSCGELLEAAVSMLAATGVGEGQWLLELYLADGRIRSARVRPPHVQHHASLGRAVLHGLRAEDFGSAA